MGYRHQRWKGRRCEILQNEGDGNEPGTTMLAVFYCGGCIYCACDENMGIRGRCDVLISVAYATNTG